MNIKEIIGDSTPFAISAIISKENIIPVLILVIVLRLLKYGYGIWMAKIPLKRTRKGIDELGQPYEDVEEFRP